VLDTASIHVGKRITAVSGQAIDHQNKNLPWSVQMGYQSTIGLTPSKTKITHGSLRIILPMIALRLWNTETSFPQFVQDGECATFGPFLRTINTITSRSTKESRSHRRATRRRILLSPRRIQCVIFTTFFDHMQMSRSQFDRM